MVEGRVGVKLLLSEELSRQRSCLVYRELRNDRWTERVERSDPAPHRNIDGVSDMLGTSGKGLSGPAAVLGPQIAK